MGLMEAAFNYDASHGAQFETYATQRIRGAMLDELRNADWMPRSSRKNLRTIEKTIHQLEHELGHAPNEQNIADALNLPLANYQQMLDDARGYQLIYYEDYEAEGENDQFDNLKADRGSNPADILDEQGFRAGLVTAIETLPEREKLVMALYYEQELNLKEIGEVLSVSESRVCQLHSQAVARLRSKLKDWLK
jgi:RNA polymerase sigma factor for flagellar operon FliA